MFTCFLFLFSPELFGQLQVTKVNDLSFGSVFKGSTYQILYDDSGAALFTFIANTKHSTNAEVRFTLPSDLKYSGYNVGITFDASHSAWSLNSNPKNATSFDPNSPLTLNNLLGQKTVYLWLGATITPDATILSGLYTGTITITVDTF